MGVQLNLIKILNEKVLPGRTWLFWWLQKAKTRIVMLVSDATDNASLLTVGNSGLLSVLESSLGLELELRLLDKTLALIPITGELHH